MGFLQEFLAKKGITVSNGAISYTRSTAESSTVPGELLEHLDDIADDRLSFDMRALKVVAAVYRAWRENDPRQAMPFVSNDFLKRWSFPDYWRPATNRSTHVKVGNTTSQEGMERVAVEVTTVADGKTFNEEWTFIRAAKTEPDGSTEIRCPSCGAPFPQVQAGTCAFCGANVVPPPVDWVVDSIRPA